MKIDKIISVSSRNRGEKDALIDITENENKISFKEYEKKINNFSLYLTNECRVRYPERIALLLENSIEQCISYFAIPKSSGVCVPLNHFLSRNEIMYCLNDCKPVMLIYGERFKQDVEIYRKECPFIKRFISEIEFNQINDMVYEKVTPNVKTSDRDEAIIMYTGGTTGFPKGVMVSHKGIVDNMLQGQMALGESLKEKGDQGIKEAKEMLESNILISIPLFHMAGMMTFMTAIFNGITVFIHKGYNINKVVSLIKKHSIQHILIVPTILISLIEFFEFREKEEIKALKQITYAASPISPNTLLKALKIFPNIKFRQIYGQTEYIGSITQLTVEDHDLIRKCPEKYGILLKSAGRVSPETELKVINDSIQIILDETIGEIILGGNSLMNGYINKEEITNETLIEIDNKKFLRTGDIGYIKEIDNKKYLFLTGRANELIKSGAEKIYPKEIEDVIFQIEGVKMNAVIGIPDEKWGEAVTAFISLKKNVKLEEQEIKYLIGNRLGRYKIPKKIVFVENFPLSAQGKILKNELKKKYWKGLDREIN